MNKIILFALLMIFNVADAGITHSVLSDGIASEANPTMRWIMDTFGMHTALLVIKPILCAICGWVLVMGVGSFSIISLAACVAFYGALTGYYAIVFR
jgi:hypothetical protein